MVRLTSESSQEFMPSLGPCWLGSVAHCFVRPASPAASGGGKENHTLLCVYQLTDRVLFSKYLQNLPPNLEPRNLVPLRSLFSLRGLLSNYLGLAVHPRGAVMVPLICRLSPQKLMLLSDFNPELGPSCPFLGEEVSSWEVVEVDNLSLFSLLICQLKPL